MEQMEPKTKKYINKRNQIMYIIESIDVVYESAEIYITTSPDLWQARKAAEKILSKFGLNKPTELYEKESPGYMITK